MLGHLFIILAEAGRLWPQGMFWFAEGKENPRINQAAPPPSPQHIASSSAEPLAPQPKRIQAA